MPLGGVLTLQIPSCLLHNGHMASKEPKWAQEAVQKGGGERRGHEMESEEELCSLKRMREGLEGQRCVGGAGGGVGGEKEGGDRWKEDTSSIPEQD